jgi:hypothetical protein
MTEGKSNKAAFWWTAIIVTVTSIAVGQVLQYIERNFLNKEAYGFSQYFVSEQSINFPLLLLVVTFISTLAIVWVYRMVFTMLPKFWIAQGLLIGLFLFLAGDFPNALLTGYTTSIPASAAQGMTMMIFLNRIINGCIMAYSYKWFTENKGA